MARSMRKKRKAKEQIEQRDPGVSGKEENREICEAGEGSDSVEGGGNDGSNSDGNISDEAPDAIPLSEGKHIAMETLKNVSDEVKRTRSNMKHKRRQIHDLFKKQKEAKKLKKLAKFPEKSLEAVARKLAEEKTAMSAKKERKKKHQQASKEKGEPSIIDVNQVGAIKLITLDVEDSGGGIGAAAGYEAACSFLQQQLFGGRHKRIPALSQQAKRYRNKPAKNFTSNQPQST